MKIKCFRILGFLSLFFMTSCASPEARQVQALVDEEVKIENYIKESEQEGSQLKIVFRQKNDAACIDTDHRFVAELKKVHYQPVSMDVVHKWGDLYNALDTSYLERNENYWLVLKENLTGIVIKSFRKNPDSQYLIGSVMGYQISQESGERLVEVAQAILESK